MFREHLQLFPSAVPGDLQPSGPDARNRSPPRHCARLARSALTGEVERGLLIYLVLTCSFPGTGNTLSRRVTRNKQFEGEWWGSGHATSKCGTWQVKYFVPTEFEKWQMREGFSDLPLRLAVRSLCERCPCCTWRTGRDCPYLQRQRRAKRGLSEQSSTSWHLSAHTLFVSPQFPRLCSSPAPV